LTFMEEIQNEVFVVKTDLAPEKEVLEVKKVPEDVEIEAPVIEAVFEDFEVPFTKEAPLNEDQFEVEMVTEVLENLETKSELFEEDENLMAYEAWERNYSTVEVKKRNKRSKLEIKELKEAKAKEINKSDRNFLYQFLPCMKSMSAYEKEEFKKKAKEIAKKVLKPNCQRT
jgi:ribosomal protein L20A (L18A)